MLSERKSAIGNRQWKDICSLENFRKLRRDRTLTGISMHVEKGEVVTLIGANGAGKTTTLRTITGLLEPRAGKIIYEGEDISSKPTHKLVARGISMSPEGRGVFANLSVRENLQMGAYLNRNKKEVAPTWSALSRCSRRLKERESQKAGTLSGVRAANARHRTRL